MKSDLHKIEVQLHHETEVGSDDKGAVLVSLDGDRKRAVWVPKSNCELTKQRGGLAILEAPEWLLVDKGLV